MFHQLARGRQRHAQLNTRLRAAVPFVMALVVYTSLLVAGTAHMPQAERETALLGRKSLGEPVLHLSVDLGGRLCVFDEVLVGDGLLRVGSQCLLQRGVANRERKAN